jgi:site-specific DNA recombinase
MEKNDGGSKTKEKKRVVGYVRVSTDEQAKGFSLESQRARIENYVATKEDWTLVGFYVEDGASAYADKERPEFKRMMDDVDEWDMTIACYLNRFWRNTRKAMEWFDDLRARGKDFTAMDYGMDSSTAMGEFVLTFMSGLAKLESAQTSERVNASRKVKFEDDTKDSWATRPPYGYDMVDGCLIVNEREAEGVRLAFRLAERYSLADTGIALGHRGYTTKAGNHFGIKAVNHILHNPAYCGYVYREGLLRRNGHPAIVDDDLFNRVQVALHSRRKNPKMKSISPLVVGDKQIHVVRHLNQGSGSYYSLTDSEPQA